MIKRLFYVTNTFTGLIFTVLSWLKGFAQAQTQADRAVFDAHFVAKRIVAIVFGLAYPTQGSHGYGGFAESIIAADDDLVVRSIADCVATPCQGFIPAMCIGSPRGEAANFVWGWNHRLMGFHRGA